MGEITTEGWFYLMGAIAFFIWGIAIFLFGRISVKHIEREMAKEGLEPPVWDKGIGSIIVTYSLIMVFPKLNPVIVDFAAVRRYTRSKDYSLAVFLLMSSVVFFALMGVAYYLYAPVN